MRVIIADDQAFIRRGLRALLADEKDIEVCAEAVDGKDALAKSAGAAAFVSKLLVWDKLIPSLRRVHLGETFFW